MGEDVPPEDTFLGAIFSKKGLRWRMWRFNGWERSPAARPVVDFGAAGLEEYVAIHLQGSRGSRFTVDAFPQSGKVKIYEGYREAAP